jgi:quercetin dioxygenase-like cupin family protein
VGVRRVITGHDGDRAVIKSDREIEPITLLGLPGAEFSNVWATAQTPEIDPDGTLDVSGPYFPAPGGIRIVRVSLPPESAAPQGEVDQEAVVADAEAKLPGMILRMEADHPGMHRSDTVDVGMVESGEIWLELDDGEEVCLRQGDTVIQNGTRHAWQNRSDAPCVMTFVVVGADRPAPLG